jgi:transcriptional regulator with XRE-family HTH domain
MIAENCFYNEAAMLGRPTTKEAPFFGQRLSSFRKDKGLSQRQLAEKVGMTREMIDYYERRAVNPSLDFIQKAAEALEVSVAELLGSEPKAVRRRSGPVPFLQRKLERIMDLPRKEQEFIVQLIDTALERGRRS